MELQEQFSVVGKPRPRRVDEPSVRPQTVAGGEDGVERLGEQVRVLECG